MPIYEYRCESCGADIEKLQKISDPPLRDCPACGKPALAKRVSASSFRLKGSGWYETDFKTGKKKNGVADAAGESGGSDAKPDTSTGAGGSGGADTKAASGGKDSAKSAAPAQKPGSAASASPGGATG